MINQELLKKVLQARKNCPYTNCYKFDTIEKSKSILEINNSLLFSVEDHGVNRLYFFVKEIDELKCLISELPRGRYCIEYMSRNTYDFDKLGFSEVARLMRMENFDCRNIFSDNNIIKFRDN